MSTDNDRTIDIVESFAQLLVVEKERLSASRILEMLATVLGKRARIGDASRYIYAYARQRGYDIPPYPLAGCGEIRQFFHDEEVVDVPSWYSEKMGIERDSYQKLPMQTMLVILRKSTDMLSAETGAFLIEALSSAR